MRKIYLHIGQSKAGSSSIQNFFYNNRVNIENFYNLCYDYQINLNFYSDFNKLNGNGYFIKDFLLDDQYLLSNSSNSLQKVIDNFFTNKDKDYFFSSEYIDVLKINIDKLTYFRKLLNENGFRLLIIYIKRDSISRFRSIWSQKAKTFSLESRDMYKLFEEEVLKLDEFDFPNFIKIIGKENYIQINYKPNKNFIFSELFKIFNIKKKLSDFYYLKNVNESHSFLETLIAIKFKGIEKFKYIKHVNLLINSNNNYYKEFKYKLNYSLPWLSKNSQYKKFTDFYSFCENYILPKELSNILSLASNSFFDLDRFKLLYKNSKSNIEIVMLLIVSFERAKDYSSHLILMLEQSNFENDFFRGLLSSYRRIVSI